ncbi:hypothetical protein [Streptomyces zagrosensis]|uniref:Uncharacterized protein n=1 Tax=Streptomyces zagrosensis TaxID=1042984 RepID=A0A7W9Q7C8_9ACTN|nr:hypothetical protein [Streptomyces zagrosensis]MBB5934543.1 hypothetical protein [Streptomyces zagrosensis]
MSPATMTSAPHATCATSATPATPAVSGRTTSGYGSTALPAEAAACAAASAPRSGTDSPARRPLGAALHAVKVFTTAAFSVAVMGDYEDAGVRRR